MARSSNGGSQDSLYTTGFSIEELLKPYEVRLGGAVPRSAPVDLEVWPHNVLPHEAVFPPPPEGLDGADMDLHQDFIDTYGTLLGCPGDDAHMVQWADDPAQGYCVCMLCGFVVGPSYNQLRFKQKGAQFSQDQEIVHDGYGREKKPFRYTPAYHLKQYLNKMTHLPPHWSDHHRRLLANTLQLKSRKNVIRPVEVKLAMKMHGFDNRLYQYAYAVAYNIAPTPQLRPPLLSWRTEQNILTCHVLLTEAFKRLKERGLTSAQNMLNYNFSIHHILERILDQPYAASMWPMCQTARARKMDAMFGMLVAEAGGAKKMRAIANNSAEFFSPTSASDAFSLSFASKAAERAVRAQTGRSLPSSTVDVAFEAQEEWIEVSEAS